jgi:hypothetical protein
MKAIHPLQSQPSVLQRTARLSPAHQLVLRLHCLTFPPMARNEFVECLKAAAQR